MELIIKETAAQFLNCPVDQINESTQLDRKSLGGSIHLHRFFARLAEKGIEFEDYSKINTIGDILRSIANRKTHSSISSTQLANNLNLDYPNVKSNDISIGVDIEEISAMPISNDFRTDAFYGMNFHPTEIAHAVLQKNPYQSFAGLFAVKEALVKANASIRKLNFNSIVVSFDEEGKPFFDGYSISIAHSGAYAIAVAVRVENPAQSLNEIKTHDAGQKRNGFYLLLIIFSLILSIAALYISISK